MAPEVKENPTLSRMVQWLTGALGNRLHSVVLYGSAARGDFHKATSDFNLLLVLESLDPQTLETVSPAIRKWRRLGQPFPRLFSPALIADSADVFPIEFLDIQTHHVVLYGKDPFADVVVQRGHLRLQCERELREKMMRLREGYVEAGGAAQKVRRLLTQSYPTFVALFRGCLHLLGGDLPVHNPDVVAAFCARAGLDRSPFEQVELLKRGVKVDTDPTVLFSSYYDQLTKAIQSVDRFEPETQESGV